MNNGPAWNENLKDAGSTSGEGRSIRPPVHHCQDETATVVNGKWRCNCPGGHSRALRKPNACDHFRYPWRYVDDKSSCTNCGQQLLNDD